MKKILIAGMIVLATAGSALAQHRHGYRAGQDRKSTRLNSSHMSESRMPSSA